MGNWFAAAVMIAWIPIVICAFTFMRSGRAAIFAFLFAWLFLPEISYKIAEGIPVYSKMTATCLGVMIGTVLFDYRRLVSFHPSWFDLPMVLWCACPMFSSVQNGLGAYDGLSEVTYQTITWGIPYFIGRLYFRTADDLKELAIALVIGGMVYVPLCLWEVRMSPQLQNWIYGYGSANWQQVIRYGGYRPVVFMQDGLMVGMWMAMCTLVGAWLWQSGRVRRIWRFRIEWCVITLAITTILCKSTGSIVLLLAGILVLFITKWSRTRVALFVLILLGPTYITLRTTKLWNGEMLLQAAEMISEDRAQSLEFRLFNEDILIDKALQSPIFGWGGWGRARVFDESGKDQTITDGLWIIALGTQGLVGLTALTVVMLLPSFWVFRKFSIKDLSRGDTVPVAVFSVILVCYYLDCIPNGMVNPIFMLICGGLVTSALPRKLAIRINKNIQRVGAVRPGLAPMVSETTSSRPAN